MAQSAKASPRSNTHNVELHIVNNSDVALGLADDWFWAGRLADGQFWPQSIPPGTDARILCCESDWLPLGCSGWVKYTAAANGIQTPFYMAFSNPVVGANGVDIGAETSVWDDMTAHYDCPVSRAFQLDQSIYMTAMIESTSGDMNRATYTIQLVDVSRVVEANLQLDDVVSVFANIPATPSYRNYYKCSDSPTSLTGLAQSHFKGIASYAGKMIFSHTNLDIMPTQNGKTIVADLLPGPSLAATEGTFDTLHPGWPHPCSTQACGSFMALGIQASANSPGSDVSQIQILDIRRAEVNMPFALIGTIERPQMGVNGVGFTRMAGASGLYLIAAGNGSTLTLYRSRFPQLIGGVQETAEFDEISQTDSFAESGAGLALLTQADGSIFLVTMNADDDGTNSKACLYEVTNVEGPSPSPAVNKVAEVFLPITDMSDTVASLQKYIGVILPIPVLGPALQSLLAEGTKVLNSSFRWGKGLTITSPTTIELYASDRNVIPLSSIPVVGSDKDFSVVVWASAVFRSV